MRVPTVIIETDNGNVVINLSEYNSETMKLADTTALTPVAPMVVPAAPAAVDANGNPVNVGDGGQFVPPVVPAAPVTPDPAFDANGLRLDGPTVAEYVAAGYMAANYPPAGFASKSTPEEIAAAVEAAKPAAPVELAVMKKGKKFIVVDKTDGKPVERDGIEPGGYATDGEAWAAIMALAG